MLLQRREREPIQPGDILSQPLVSDAGFVFAVGEVETPMAANGAGEALHAQVQAAEERADVSGLLAVTHAREDRHADRPEPFPAAEPRQVLRGRHLHVSSSFFATMPGFLRHVPTRVHPREVVRDALVDIINDGLVQLALVSLQRQQVIGLTLDDLRGDGRLGSHGVDRDDGSVEVHEPQYFGNRRDFARFLRARDLGQRQAIVAGPGADRMQRAQSLGSVMAPRPKPRRSSPATTTASSRNKSETLPVSAPTTPAETRPCPARRWATAKLSATVPP